MSSTCPKAAAVQFVLNGNVFSQNIHWSLLARAVSHDVHSRSAGCNTTALVHKLPDAAVYRIPQRNKAACVKLFEMLEQIRNNIEELCSLPRDLVDLVHTAPGRRLLWIFWYTWY